MFLSEQGIWADFNQSAQCLDYLELIHERVGVFLKDCKISV
jgi:hypothetical protein